MEKTKLLLIFIFFKGLRELGKDEKVGKDERAAYVDGVEARAVALISDVVDYPGNSVLTELLLAQVKSRDKYSQLFTGGRTEHSFGRYQTKINLASLKHRSIGKDHTPS